MLSYLAFAFPVWSFPLLTVGINFGIMGLKKVAPKIPSVALPFINIGIATGLSFLANQGMTIDPAWIAAVSGVAALTHNVVKNALQ